jgi:hypothetical protein
LYAIFSIDVEKIVIFGEEMYILKIHKNIKYEFFSEKLKKLKKL